MLLTWPRHSEVGCPTWGQQAMGEGTGADQVEQSSQGCELPCFKEWFDVGGRASFKAKFLCLSKDSL